MKKCTICKEEKSLDEFNKSKRTNDGLNNICRVCSNTKSKEYYQNNKEHHKKVIAIRNKKLIDVNRQKLFDYYKTNPCIDCGNNNPIVLELDHRDGCDKIATVSFLVHSGCSWNKIQEEIDKCDVRCANCHRIKTAIQFDWYQRIEQ